MAAADAKRTHAMLAESVIDAGIMTPRRAHGLLESWDGDVRRTYGDLPSFGAAYAAFHRGQAKSCELMLAQKRNAPEETLRRLCAERNRLCATAKLANRALRAEHRLALAGAEVAGQ